MRKLLLAHDEVLLDEEPVAALQSVVEHANALGHKLTPEELDALDDLAERISQLGAADSMEDAADLMIELDDRVLRRVLGTYYAAHMIPVGRAALSGKADDVEPSSADDSNMTPGMQQSLRLLHDSGALGMMVAQMYRMTGVLERDYSAINAVNFGEVDPVTGRVVPTGLSREARVEEIIHKYRRAAGFVGIGAGVVGLIPIAGVPLSVSGETFALFKLHAQMAFEIAAVHGWDIREGNNLYRMSMLFMTDGMLTELGDVLASNIVVPLLAQKAAQKLGVELSADIAAQIAQRSITQLMALFSKEAQEALAKEAIEGSARGIASQLLGWATVGLSIAVSGGLNWFITDQLGRHVETLATRWLHDLMLEGTSYLAKPEARDCAFRALSAIAWQDGEVTDREQRLFVAYLAKPYNVDEANWFFLTGDERIRHARTLRRWRFADSPEQTGQCLRDAFQHSLSQHRVSLLGHAYAMIQIDGEEDPDERSLYREWRDGLDGDGFFDGEPIKPAQLDYVERSIFITTHPSAAQVDPDAKETLEALLVEDVLDYVADPDPEAMAAFLCGFADEC